MLKETNTQHFEKVISCKINPEMEQMIKFIQKHTLMSKSTILRYGLKKTYDEFNSKFEGGK